MEARNGATRGLQHQLALRGHHDAHVVVEVAVVAYGTAVGRREEAGEAGADPCLSRGLPQGYDDDDDDDDGVNQLLQSFDEYVVAELAAAAGHDEHQHLLIAAVAAVGGRGTSVQ